MKTRSEDQVRDHVREAYARAVNAVGKASDPSCGCSCSAERAGTASKLASYDNDTLKGLPQDAVVSSFGCGNPVALTQIKAGQVVVDLGSGAGLDLLLAAEKVGPAGRVIGIDMTPEMIERARKNIADAGLKNTEVRKGIIEEMPVESGSVDWVISNCVINLSPQKQKVFKEIHRVLKPGGHMLVSDIMVKDLPQWMRENEAIYSSCVGGAISEDEYIGGLNKAGMTNVEVMSRFIYDRSQMSGMIESEIPEVAAAMSCCGQMSKEDMKKLAVTAGDDLTGKVWSATVYAEKPVR